MKRITRTLRNVFIYSKNENVSATESKGRRFKLYSTLQYV